ncbi:MAG: hypothetical protein AB7P76_00925 [Candidatus Melainabacteria bacterium]
MEFSHDYIFSPQPAARDEGSTFRQSRRRALAGWATTAGFVGLNTYGVAKGLPGPLHLLEGRNTTGSAWTDPGYDNPLYLAGFATGLPTAGLTLKAGADYLLLPSGYRSSGARKRIGRKIINREELLRIKRENHHPPEEIARVEAKIAKLQAKLNK